VSIRSRLQRLECRTALHRATENSAVVESCLPDNGRGGPPPGSYQCAGREAVLKHLRAGASSLGGRGPAMTMRIHSKRLETAARRVPPAKDRYDNLTNEDWLKLFEAWCREGHFASEPDFPVALAYSALRSSIPGRRLICPSARRPTSFRRWRTCRICTCSTGGTRCVPSRACRPGLAHRDAGPLPEEYTSHQRARVIQGVRHRNGPLPSLHFLFFVF
jgi:hypothetical protein